MSRLINEDKAIDIDKDIKYYAQKLSDLISKSDEFTDYCLARENLEKDKNYSHLLADFRQQQLQLHLAALAGEDTMEEVRDFESVFRDLSQEPLIKDFLSAEARFYTLLTQVQKILGKDLELWSEYEVMSPKTDLILN
ncbi:MAG: YlbF family regulator [Bacillota bacterium]|jgi:cell fate (sporulation/competence/biofilm development) regulator YlbF (YheA/YmcA/DUF963 family)